MNLPAAKNTDFSPNARQAKLLDLILKSGFTETETAARTFDRTTQTIRRDFELLEEHGLIRRVHGGAKAPHEYINRPYAERLATQSTQKDKIGTAAAGLITDNACVFLSLGTSTEAVARHLTGHEDMQFVTNNLNIAHLLQDVPGSELIVCGGIVRPHDGAMLDSRAFEIVEGYRFDYAVIGTGAVTNDGELYCGSLDEARMAQAIIANSDVTVLVADEKKIGRKANHKLAHMDEIDIFVTEDMKDKGLIKVCQKNNVKVIIAA